MTFPLAGAIVLTACLRPARRCPAPPGRRSFRRHLPLYLQNRNQASRPVSIVGMRW
jgi:hypothetical protein